MLSLEHRKNLLTLTEELGIVPEASQLEALLAFQSEVETWNRKLDLTGASEPKAQCEVLFADALVSSRVLDLPPSPRFVDVGSGAGIPSIPFAILRPDLHFVLVEPLHKRCAFMRQTIGKLGLQDRIKVEESRLELLALHRHQRKEHGRAFDVASSRATFDPIKWMDVAKDLAEIVFVYEIHPTAEHPDWKRAQSVRYKLPFSQAPRCLSIFHALAKSS